MLTVSAKTKPTNKTKKEIKSPYLAPDDRTQIRGSKIGFFILDRKNKKKEKRIEKMKNQIKTLSQIRPELLTWSQIEIKLYELQRELCEKKIEKAKIEFEIETRTIHKDYYEYDADHKANKRLTQYIQSLEEEIIINKGIRSEIAQSLAQGN